MIGEICINIEICIKFHINIDSINLSIRSTLFLYNIFLKFVSF